LLSPDAPALEVEVVLLSPDIHPHSKSAPPQNFAPCPPVRPSQLSSSITENCATPAESKETDMPTPETHAKTVLDLLVTLGGGAVGGATLSEIVRYLFTRNKSDAETWKLNAEAMALLDSAVRERTAQIMSSDKARIERLEQRLDEMSREYIERMENTEREHGKEIARLWDYITSLRNKLIKNNIEVPLAPEAREES
jgi:hypothetical protein